MNEVTSSIHPLSVLIVDDDKSLRESLQGIVESSGYNTSTSGSAPEALQALENQKFELILCDLRMPDVDGLKFIAECKKTSPNTEIILMTAFGNTELALQAMRAGAYDYLSKPFSADELILTLKKVEEREHLRTENENLKSAIVERYTFSNIVAESKPMLDIFETVKRLSQFNTTILITGESGTGKELLARAIHNNSSRRSKPFVAINCGAIPENLMESELFGHKKGAFTDASRDKRGLFEEAHGGTIFLDEIGELPPHLQVKLLRALQEQKIRRVGDETVISLDVRIIAATLRDLDKDVLSGRFREDLFYRLNVVPIHIPALRERLEDIPALVEHFMKKHSKRLGLPNKKISTEAMRLIHSYGWRGNVRELENCIERALVLSENDLIYVDSLPPQLQVKPKVDLQTLSSAPMSEDNLSIKQRTRTLEIELIKRALKKTGGNKTHAAKILEISHRALLYKLKEYELREAE